MTSVKLVIPISIAVLALTALTALNPTLASATTPGWMLNGTMLSAEGGTATIATETIIDKEFELSTTETNVECSKALIDNGLVKETNDALAGSILFSGCATRTANCTVPEAIGTVPVLTEVTLDTGTNVKGIAKPVSGTTFATIKFSGNACAISGTKGATGDVEILGDEGQIEKTSQLILGVQETTGLLKFASNAASFKGAALIISAHPGSFL